MADNYDVEVSITQETVIGSVGFGTPLIFAGKETKAGPYKECSSLEEIKSAGFAEETNTYKAAKLLFMQDNAPKTIAVCASTEVTATALGTIMDKAWRQLIVVSLATEEESTVKEIADYIETTKDRVLFMSVESTVGLAGMNGLDRTYAIVYGGATEFPEAAIVGATAGLDAGSFTYKNMILKGVEPEKLSASELSAIHESNGNAILQKAGDVVPSEGKAISGQYLDIVDSKDYIISNIQYKEQKLFNLNPKVPYTNKGIAAMENEVINVLLDACSMGIIATDDDDKYIYSTNFPPRSDVSETDRAERVYRSGRFSFELAGAVHNVKINGTLSV